MRLWTCHRNLRCMTSPPTGWHPDPEDPGRERWWDGNTGQWLDHTRTKASDTPGPASAGPPPPPSKSTGRLILTIVGALMGFVVLAGAVGAIADGGGKDEEATGPAPSMSSAPVAPVTPTTTATSKASTTTQKTTTTTSKKATTTKTTAPKTTPKPPPPRPTYPGARDNDAVADDRGQVEVRGLTAIVGPLRKVEPADFDGPRLCSDLRFENRGSETEYYDSFDFSIQYPSGNEKGTVIGYAGDVHTGNLVPGGQTSGQVCFVDRMEVGQHLVLWNRTDLSSFSTPRRGVWLFNL